MNNLQKACEMSLNEEMERMTVTEIIKVLRLRVQQQGEIEKLYGLPQGMLARNDVAAINLITRLQAENEVYSHNIKKLTDEQIQSQIFNKSLKGKLKNAIDKFKEMRTVINEKDTEIARLNKEVDRLSQCVLYYEGYIADAKNEAIKEVAEKVKVNKNKLFNYIFSNRGFDEQIDNFVKELLG